MVSFSVMRLTLRSLVPWKSRGAALLALTGDIEFNRHIRVRAGNLGMHLNEFGLWRWQSNTSEEPDVGTEEDIEGKGFWELMKADTEEDILTELGMEWIEPTKRNFVFVAGKKRTTRTAN
jgi:DNA polymerase beta